MPLERAEDRQDATQLEALAQDESHTRADFRVASHLEPAVVRRRSRHVRDLLVPGGAGAIDVHLVAHLLRLTVMVEPPNELGAVPAREEPLEAEKELV